MILHWLSIRNFRGIAAADFEFDDTGVTLIDGHNESGKTSVVEAFAMLLNYPSTSKAAPVVAAQRQQNGEAVEVCAELSFGEQRLRYFKRFARPNAPKKQETELRFITPVRSPLRGKEAHTYVEELLESAHNGKLWDKLRIAQSRETGQLEGLTEIGALKRALDAQAGDTSPTADDSLFAAVMALRDQYFTKAGKPRGEWAALQDAEQEARARYEEAVTAARELDGHVDAMTTLIAAVQRKDELLDQAQEDLLVAQKAADALADIAVRHEAVAEKRKLADLQVANARAERERRGELADRVRTSVEKVERLNADKAEKTAELDPLARSLGEDQKAVESAEKLTEDKRRAVARLTTHIGYLEAESEARARRRKVARNEELVGAIAELNRRIDAGAVTEESVRELRGAAQRATELRAVAEAATSRVEIDGSGPVIIDGESVEAGDGWNGYVRRNTEIRVGDVRITLRPGHEAADAAQQAEKADNELAELLSAAGVESVSDAEDALAEIGDRRRELAGLTGQLEALWAGESAQSNEIALASCQARIAALAESADAEMPQPARSEDIDSDPDAIAAIGRQLDTLRSQLRQAEADLQQAGDASAQLTAAAEASKSRLQRCQWDLESLDKQIGEAQAAVDEARSMLDQAQKERPDDKLDAAVATAEKERDLVEADAQAVDHEYEQATVYAELHDKDLAKAALDRHRTDRDQMVGQRTALQTRIELLSEDGPASRLEEDKAAWEQLAAQLESVDRRAHAARLLAETMDHHRNAEIAGYAEPLRAELLAGGRVIFGHDFDLSLGDDLTVSARRLGGTTIDYESLSGGAKEQFALLTRIVCAKLAGGNAVPIFLDDTLGYTDPERRRAMAKVIHDAGAHSQIIVLTCDEERFRHLGAARRYSMSYPTAQGEAARDLGDISTTE